MDAYRTPDERFRALDDAPRSEYVELHGDLEGLRMHCAVYGSGRPVLMLHGEPTWSWLYRNVVSGLSSPARVVAPDFIGFGRSDKVTSPAWYSYDRHVESLRQVVAGLNLRDVVLVVHDWGGPVGLRVAVENPELFSGIVMLNTGLFRPGGNWPSPAWLAFRDYVASNPDLQVSEMVLGGCARPLPDVVAAAYDAPFPNRDSKAGVIAFPQLVPTSVDAPGAAEMARVRELLTRWTKPLLVAFSDSDPIFPARSGRRWVERIPGAFAFAEIADAGHFLQEDNPTEVAAAIDELLRKV